MGLKRETQADDHFEVWPDTWPAIELFIAMGTQWRRGPRGHLAGLDYTVLPIAAAGIGRKWRPLFDDLQTIECAYMKEANRE
jgi:hypothetical protein